MIIDVFTYSQSTPNAPFSIESLIEAAKCARLDGIAITDRASSGRVREYERIAAREEFLVVYGVELETSAGRVTAYPQSIDDEFVNEGWRSLGECPEVESVLEYFHQRGGIVVARDIYHRGEGMKDRVYSAKDSNGRGFDAVDTLAVYRRRIDNELSIEAQNVLGAPACAGSGVFDCLEDIGHCATLFSSEIHDQPSFVAAMRGVLHWAVALRDMGESCPMGTPPRSDDDDWRDDGRRPRRDDRRGGERREGRGARRDGGRGPRRDDDRRANRDDQRGNRSGDRRGGRGPRRPR